MVHLRIDSLMEHWRYGECGSRDMIAVHAEKLPRQLPDHKKGHAWAALVTFW